MFEGASLRETCEPYNLDPASVSELLALLKLRFSPEIDNARAHGKGTLCIVVDGLDALSNLGRTVEQVGFQRLADNLPADEMHRQYGDYENRSLFFLGYDIEKEDVVASMRIVTGIVGIGPVVKTIHDTLRHEEYLKAPLGGEVLDLRDQLGMSADGDLQDAEVGALGSSGLRTGPNTRRWIESFHGMENGRLIFDIATVVRRESGSGSRIWTTMMVAGALRAAKRSNARYGVTFVTQEVMTMMRKLTATPWIDLAGRTAVPYLDGDDFLSQPAFIDFDRYRSELAAGYHLLSAGSPSGHGRAFDQLAMLTYSPDEDASFVL